MKTVSHPRSRRGTGTTNLVPASIFQNGRKCTLVRVGGAAFGSSEGEVGGPGVEAGEQPISVQGPNIIGVDGKAVALKGVNWFGFDVSCPRASSRPALRRSCFVCCWQTYCVAAFTHHR